MAVMAIKSIASTVEARIKRRPGRPFTYDDFADLPASAVAPALSRLVARGKILRARKGVYYLPRTTVIGEVPPDPIAVANTIAGRRRHPAPTGLSAAHALGLTTQVPARTELAIENRRLTPPRGIELKSRLGTNRGDLHPLEAALLEVLRDIHHLTDLSSAATLRRLHRLTDDERARSRILRAAVSEPPRVRAMIGALVESAGASENELRRLRKTLNPTSRYDFGPLSELPTARAWGARASAS